MNLGPDTYREAELLRGFSLPGELFTAFKRRLRAQDRPEIRGDRARGTLKSPWSRR